MATAVHPSTELPMVPPETSYPAYREMIEFIQKETREIVYAIVKVATIPTEEIVLYHREELSIDERLDEMDQHLRRSVDNAIRGRVITQEVLEGAMLNVAMDPYLVQMLGADTLPQAMRICGVTWREKEIGKIYRSVIKIRYYMDLMTVATHIEDARLTSSEFAHAAIFAHGIMSAVEGVLEDHAKHDQNSLHHEIRDLVERYRCHPETQLLATRSINMHMIKDLPPLVPDDLGNGVLPNNW